MPVRSPETIEQIRVAYERTDTPTLVLSTLFGMSRGEIFALVREHGWVSRSSLPEQTPRARAAASQRGFVVILEGQGYRVGNAACTLAAMRAKAARERRLSEAASSMQKLRHPPEHRAPSWEPRASG